MKVLPGLQDDKLHTAGLPTSLTLPDRSSASGFSSLAGLAAILRTKERTSISIVNSIVSLDISARKGTYIYSSSINTDNRPTQSVLSAELC